MGRRKSKNSRMAGSTLEHDTGGGARLDQPSLEGLAFPRAHQQLASPPRALSSQAVASVSFAARPRGGPKVVSSLPGTPGSPPWGLDEYAGYHTAQSADSPVPGSSIPRSQRPGRPLERVRTLPAADDMDHMPVYNMGGETLVNFDGGGADPSDHPSTPQKPRKVQDVEWDPSRDYERQHAQPGKQILDPPQGQGQEQTGEPVAAPPKFGFPAPALWSAASAAAAAADSTPLGSRRPSPPPVPRRKPTIAVPSPSALSRRTPPPPPQRRGPDPSSPPAPLQQNAPAQVSSPRSQSPDEPRARDLFNSAPEAFHEPDSRQQPAAPYGILSPPPSASGAAPPRPECSSSSSSSNMPSLASAPPSDHSRISAASLANFVSAFNMMTSHPGFSYVQNVFGEYEQLKDQNVRLKMSHREILEEYRRFKNELASQEGDLARARRQLEGTVKAQERELEEHAAARDHLEGALETASSACVTLAAAKARLEDSLHSTTAKLDELGVVRAHLEMDLQVASEELGDVRVERASLETAFDAASSERDELRLAKAKLESELHWTGAELTDLAAMSARLTRDIEVANSELAELREAKSRLNHDLSVTAAERDDLRALKARLELDLESARAEGAELRDARAHLQRDLDTRDAELFEERSKAERLVTTTAQEISGLQTTLDDKQELVNKLEAELKAEVEKATRSAATVQELEKKLEETEANLNEKTTTLTTLESYKVELKNEPEDTYVAILDEIWTSVMDLVSTTFSQDLPEDILADPSVWTNLTQSEHLRHATTSQTQMPLPQSNSAAAKHMRIAAVLAVMSRVLAKYIFRPVYLLEQDSGAVQQLLRDLEAVDPAKEQHYRATLLGMVPERQEQSARRRIRAAINETAWMVQHLLGALQYAAFSEALADVVQQACQGWARIQRARTKMEPHFGPPMAPAESSVDQTAATLAQAQAWQVVELPDLDDGGDDMMVELGRPYTASENGDAAAAAAAAEAETGAPETPQPSEVLLVVWPTVCVIEGSQLSSLTQGLVVTKRQARAAADELRARVTLRTSGPTKARTMSMPGTARRQQRDTSRARSFLGERIEEEEGEDPAGGGSKEC